MRTESLSIAITARRAAAGAVTAFWRRAWIKRAESVWRKSFPALAVQRLTWAEFDALPARMQGCFPLFPHDTEAGWIARGVYPQAVARSITLVLMPENIERLESAPPEESIARLEEMGENFYAEMGWPDNQRIFRFRDMYLEWQKRYIWRFAPGIYDMNDERHSSSVRRYLEKGEQK